MSKGTKLGVRYLLKDIISVSRVSRIWGSDPVLRLRFKLGYRVREFLVVQ